MLTIEYLKISELLTYDRNARTHGEDQIQQLVNSIREYGFTNPVLIDENNVLIAGHGRTEAAKQIGMQEVPAIRLKNLSENQKKALRISDNQLALNAGWDFDLLAAEISDLQDVDFDIDLLGFDNEFLDDLLAGNADDDLEGDQEEQEETMKVKVHKMTFGENEVEISAEELGQLETMLQQYVDANEYTSGFASWLIGDKGSHKKE